MLNKKIIRINHNQDFYATFLILLTFSCCFTGIFLVNSAYATVVFNDSFESGSLTNWTGTTTDGTSTITIDNSRPYSGGFNGLSSVNAAGYAKLNKDSLNLAVAYGRGYYEFSALPTSGGNVRFQLGELRSVDGSQRVGITLTYSGGNYFWGLYTVIDSNYNFYTESTPSNPLDSIYYCVEIKRDVTGQTAQLWVDGVSKLSLNGLSQVGNTERFAIGVSLADFVSPSSCSVYVDSAVVSDAYVGVEAAFLPYIERTSNIDNSADVGTHSNFTAQQYGPDSIFDVLTEVDVDTGTSILGDNSGTGSSYRTTAANEMRLGVYTASASGELQSIVFYGRGASTSQNCKGIIADSSGNILTNGVGNAVSVSTTAGTKTLTFTNKPLVTAGETYWVGLITAGAVRIYYDSTTGGTSKRDTSNSYTTPTNPTDAGDTTETWRLMYANINNLSYQLSLEEEFTNIPTNNASDLCIYAGTLGSETLNVQGWNAGNTSWTSIGSVTSGSGWNNFTVTNWVSSTEFYIRFVGSSESGDVSQDSWQVDAVYLYAYNSTSGASVAFVLSATVTTNDALASQKVLNRTFTSSVVVTAIFVSHKGLSKTLTQTITETASLNSNKGLSKVLANSVSVASGLGDAWGISRVLSASISIGSDLASSKSISNIFTALVSVGSSVDVSKSLLKSLSEVFSSSLGVAAGLSSVKTIGTVFFESVAALADVVSSKNILLHLVESLTGLVHIGDGLGVQKSLSRLFADSIGVVAVLDSGKGLLLHFVESLQADVNVIDALSVSKVLYRAFGESVGVAAGLFSNVGLNHAFSEVLSSVIAPSASLTVQKGLSQVFSAVVGASSSVMADWVIVVKNLAFVLSEAVGIREVADFGLALSVSFLEFVDSVHVDALLINPFADALTAEEMFVVGGVLAAVFVGALGAALFLVYRKKDDDY